MTESLAVTNTTAQSGGKSNDPWRTVDCLWPSENESGSARPLRDGWSAQATTNFVFVNEADHSPRFKALKRHTVRAQARIHSARLLKQQAKTGLRQLAPQKRGHGASRFLAHDKCRPLTILERRKVAGSGSKPLAHSNDLSFGDDAALSEELSPEPVDINTTVSQLSNSQGKLESYPQIFRAKSDLIGITTTQAWNSSHLSPRGVLGAGRADPFLSYPRLEPDIPELADLYFTCVLPGIYPNDHPYQLDSGNSVAPAWCSASLANPFLFNILLWVTCIKRDVLRGSRTYCNSTQALVFKVDGIRQLNKVISNGRQALTDEVILAIAGLASHEVVNVTEEKIKPFSSPLQIAGLLNTYGGLQMVPEHWNAVLRLITLRGGIENLRLNGLAECMVIGEVCGVLNSCFTIKPVFPPLRFHEQYIATVKKWAIASRPSSLQPLGKAFRKLPEYGITDTMLEVLEYMEAITLAIDHCLHGKPGGLTLGQIVRTRTGIQKRLLLLPTAKELNIGINTNITPSSRPNLYECCRLTAMIFSIAVIFPIPSTYDVLQTLVRGLITSLEVTDIESYSVDCTRVLLWVLVLGGIAALGKPERPWFVSNLVLFAERSKLDWDGAEAILKTFLWLESACSPGGRQLWDEVMVFAG